MQNQSRLLRVYCVIRTGCTCYWPKPASVMMTTDSESYANKFKNELDADSDKDVCEKCGHIDQHFVDSAEYYRKHFIYKD